jgi:hypothetical protein
MNKLHSVLGFIASASLALTPAIALAQVTSQPYPAEILKALTEQCIQKSQSANYCQCFYGKLPQRMTLNEFLLFGFKLEQDQTTPSPPAFEQTARECFHTFEGDPSAIAKLIEKQYGGSEGAYPQVLAHQLTESCIQGGDTPTYCRCFIQQLEQRIPLEQLIQLATSKNPLEATPPAFFIALEMCQESRLSDKHPSATIRASALIELLPYKAENT